MTTRISTANHMDYCNKCNSNDILLNKIIVTKFHNYQGGKMLLICKKK